MNETVKNFLYDMKAKIEADILSDAKKRVEEKIVENLGVLIEQGIITRSEATEFSKENNILFNIKNERKEKVISREICSDSIRHSRC